MRDDSRYTARTVFGSIGPQTMPGTAAYTSSSFVIPVITPMGSGFVIMVAAVVVVILVDDI